MLKQSPKQTAIARKLRKADTWAEQLLWRWLCDRRFSAYKFRRQQPMGVHTLDFYCPEAKVNIGQNFPPLQGQNADFIRNAIKFSITVRYPF